MRVGLTVPVTMESFTQTSVSWKCQLDQYRNVVVANDYTLLARLGRTCASTELDPKYVAVTLERWQQMTGREPYLVAP